MQTKEKIIEVSGKIIAQEGLRNFTAKNIGKALGITDAAVFKHFKDMNDIIQAVVLRYSGACISSIKEVFSDESLNMEQKLDKIMDIHIDMLESTEGIVPIICLEVARSNNLYDASVIKDFLNTYKEILTTLLNDGIQKGFIRKDIDVEEASFTFFGLLQSRVLIWLLNDKKGPIVKDRKTLKTIFKKGILEDKNC